MQSRLSLSRSSITSAFYRIAQGALLPGERQLAIAMKVSLANDPRRHRSLQDAGVVTVAPDPWRHLHRFDLIPDPEPRRAIPSADEVFQALRLAG